MSARRNLPAPLLALTAAGLLLAGCGKGSSVASSGTQPIAPVAKQGAVSVVTRNTTRLGGSSAAADAAAVARAVYPGLTTASRPQAVVLVNEHDWNAALASSVLAGAPVGAPILFSEGDSLPEVTSEAIEALRPTGIPALGGVKVIRLGTSASVPGGLRAVTLPAIVPSATAAAIQALQRRVSAGAAPRQVILVQSRASKAFTMPAAGLAAESGAPILFTGPARVPDATLAVLGSLHDPTLYVVDPTAIGTPAMELLRRFGHVSPISPSSAPGEGAGPIANAIALARFTDGSFGWGIKEPGHGLVFANDARPLDGPAAALLSASGEYGPMLLFGSAHRIPPPLSSYLSDIQPAYTSQPAYRPVRGVYNHGWLIGDEAAISAVTQAEIDSLLEISPSKQNGEEAYGEQFG